MIDYENNNSSIYKQHSWDDIKAYFFENTTLYTISINNNGD